MINFDDITPTPDNQRRIDSLNEGIDDVPLMFIIELLAMRDGKTPHEMLEDSMIRELIEGSQDNAEIVIADLERIFDLMIEE